jgi:hypothetical protein
VSLPFLSVSSVRSSHLPAMSKSTKYWNTPATCKCLACIAENPNGQIVTRLKRDSHISHQLRDSLTIQHRGTSRGLRARGTAGQRSSFTSRGRPGGTRPVRPVRKGPQDDLPSQLSIAPADSHGRDVRDGGFLNEVRCIKPHFSMP